MISPAAAWAGSTSEVTLIARRRSTRRIEEKPPDERGDSKWLYKDSFRDKKDFVDKTYETFGRMPAEVEIDTTCQTPEEVLEEVLREVGVWMELPEGVERGDREIGRQGDKE